MESGRISGGGLHNREVVKRFQQVTKGLRFVVTKSLLSFSIGSVCGNLFPVLLGRSCTFRHGAYALSIDVEEDERRASDAKAECG